MGVVHLRNKKNTIEEHYTILGLLQCLGGNLPEQELTLSKPKEFYYLEDVGNGKMIIKTTDVTNLEAGEIYTYNEFLAKYIVCKDVKLCYFDDVFKVTREAKLLCTVIRTDEQTNRQKVFYGCLKGNDFCLLKADDKEWRKFKF